MSKLEFFSLILTILIGFGTLTGMVWRVWEKDRPARERREAADTLLVGKAPVLDEAGEILIPEQPGIAAVLRDLRSDVNKLVDQDARITNLERARDDHSAQLSILNPTVAALVSASAERANTAAASAEAFRLIRDRDSLEGEEVQD